MATELFKRTDGRFVVRAWTEGNVNGRPRHRVRFQYVGPDTGASLRSRDGGQASAASPEQAIADASAIWRAYLDGELGAPPPPTETLGALCDLYSNRRDLARATRDGSERTLKMLTDRFGRDTLVQNLGKAGIQAWLDRMTCKPVSRASYLRTVRGMFRWAVAGKLTPRDVTEGVIAIQKHERTPHVIRPWLQKPDWAPFLDACPPTHRIRAEFTLHTGLRAGELMAARWDWLHGTVGRPALTVPRMKSKAPRAIPLDDRAQACLAAAKAKWPDSQYIFSKGGEGQGNLCGRNVGACGKAGISPHVDFHGLRRSAGARWLELGASILEVSRLLGHQDVSTTARHYAGIADATLARVMDRADAAEQVTVSNVVPIRVVGGRKGGS